MKISKIIIILISVLVPVVIALLFVFTTAKGSGTTWINQLPLLNASINSLTAVILIIAFIMIKNGKEKAHRNLMLTAFALGAIFLVSYITYHASIPSTVFGDVNHDGLLSVSEQDLVGNTRLFYLVILLSHILMAITGLPLVLLAVYHGIQGNRQSHKKIVKFTFPVWLFISLSGVVVYFLISPYY